MALECMRFASIRVVSSSLCPYRKDMEKSTVLCWKGQCPISSLYLATNKIRED